MISDSNKKYTQTVLVTKRESVILGAGMTGLAAGLASGFPIYEARESPGGICSSYYIRPGTEEKLPRPPKDEEVYRFEIGGGHWIWGGDRVTLRLVRSMVPIKAYIRRASVYLPQKDLFIPYPIQEHLRYLEPNTVAQILQECLSMRHYSTNVQTLEEWLQVHYGPTLCQIFFNPFHELYTAGLWKRVVPQDPHKSPASVYRIIQGAIVDTPPVGYNATFHYPETGLNILAEKMAQHNRVHYNKHVVYIDVKEKSIHFGDGSTLNYDIILSTLPLDHMLKITNLNVDATPDPAISVLVFNIGAIKGPRCPQDHWVYIPNSKAGFHRVGFYSNVDPSFLPASSRKSGDRVSIYVEKSYVKGSIPSEEEVRRLKYEIVQELQKWGWIEDVEVLSPTWVEVAYTWSWPRSHWKEQALTILEKHGIYQVGRYARWAGNSHGIMDSIRDGLIAGAALKG